MPTKFLWIALRQLRHIWVRVVAIALLAVVAAILAQALAVYIPQDWTDQVGATAVDEVLSILATSMLAVTTFSLSIAVSAFAAAASSATPRATALLQEDTTTQNVLATFLGAFLFSLVGIVALKAGYYSESGTLVMFVATVLVILLVVIALLRWISHLMIFGRIEDTLNRVERATQGAIAERLRNPWLRGRPWTEAPPEDARAIAASETGYIQMIDMAKLSERLRPHDGLVWVRALPGSFVHPSEVLMHYTGADLSDEDVAGLRDTIVCGPQRNYDQDPRFGLVVLAEIASRALSPGINDPGTAIDVIGRILRLMTVWRRDVPARIDYPNVIVPSLEVEDLMVHAFRPIARDGAGVIEVQLRLRRALEDLRRVDPGTFAQASDALIAYADDCVDRSNMPGADRAALGRPTGPGQGG